MTGFQTAPLGSICDILDSKRKPITKKDRIAGPFPYYGATGVLDHVDGYLFNEDLVLVGEDGAKWGSGELTAFPISGKCWVNNHAHVLRPDRKQIIDNWLIYYLNFSDLKQFVSGLTVPKLNQGQLRQIPIPLPPLPEQKRIVAILDEAFAAIDTAIANTEKNLANARELFESKLNYVFVNGDAGWKTASLGEVSERVSVGHVGPTKDFYCDKDSGIPFLRSQNVRRGRLNLEDGLKYVTQGFHDKLKKSQLREGDLLFVRVGANRGDCCSVPGGLGSINCANIVFARPRGVSVEYLTYYCDSKIGRSRLLGMTTGSAQGVINTKSVAGLPIPLPDSETQKRVVETLDNSANNSEHLASAYARKRILLLKLKGSLLNDAFLGKLTVDRVNDKEEVLA